MARQGAWIDVYPFNGRKVSIYDSGRNFSLEGDLERYARPEGVHCPNTWIHEPCGYMASRNFVPNSVSDNPEYSHDPRLFDAYVQLEKKREELANTFGVSAQDVNYVPTQDFLAAGWLTKEMYFSTTGKINAEQKNLKLPEKGEFIFVPFEHLKELIYHQGRLSKVNPIGYRPSDSREIPLIDESLIGLIYGYENLTGEKLDVNETVERLNHDGLSIRVYDTSAGWGYKFPVKF